MKFILILLTSWLQLLFTLLLCFIVALCNNHIHELYSNTVNILFELHMFVALCNHNFYKIYSDTVNILVAATIHLLLCVSVALCKNHIHELYSNTVNILTLIFHFCFYVSLCWIVALCSNNIFHLWFDTAKIIVSTIHQQLFTFAFTFLCSGISVSQFLLSLCFGVDLENSSCFHSPHCQPSQDYREIHQKPQNNLS